VIDVCNNGHPISPDSQEQIFIPFFTTKPEGSGIGLSLSRQIMRLHNGSIRLVRSDEKGTIFTLVFR
jgi:signal transduction histidine kinase